MVQDIEVGSPPNRLKRIVSSLFKKNGADDAQVGQAGSATIGSQQPVRHQQSAANAQLAATPQYAAPGSDTSLPCNVAKATSDAGSLAHSTASAGNRSAYHNVRENVLSDPGMPLPSPSAREELLPTEADIAAATASLPVGQRSSNGSINEPGASVWQHEAAIGSMPPSVASSPAPTQRNGPHARVGRGPPCQSIDDMYSVIFGDGPQCTAGSSLPSGPCANVTEPTVAVGSASGVQYGYQHMGSCRSPDLQVVLSATEPDSSKSSITAHGRAARSSSSVIGPLDDLIVPAGLPRIRTGSRPSGALDGSMPALCADTCAPSTGEAAADGAIIDWHEPAVLSVPLGPGASPRYVSLKNSSSSPTCGAEVHQPQQLLPGSPHNCQRRLWDRRQKASLNSGADGSCSSSGVSTPCPDIATEAGSASEMWHMHTSTSRTGPVNFADIAAQLGGRCLSPDDMNTPFSHSSCSATPLSRSYSNTDAASTATGAMPPACARALFGSATQMDRPLMSVGSGSWLTRADSSLMGDHLSVASDDEYIREVNAENVLSSVWGPANGASKLLSFKYSVATSPLNHPGRASPFRTSPFRASPFNSPRGSQRDNSMLELPPLRSAASAVHSCPGSPLAHQTSSNPLSDIALSTTAAQNRHRHPFGRCTADSSSTYRPSPLQQPKQWACEELDSEKSQQPQQVCVKAGVSSQDPQCSVEPVHNCSVGHTLDEGALGPSCEALSAQPTPDHESLYTDTAESKAIHCNSRVSDRLLGQEASVGTAQLAISACKSSRHPSSSSRAGSRAGGSTAATVSALMAGWDTAIAAIPVSHERKQSRRDDQSSSSTTTTTSPVVCVPPVQLMHHGNSGCSISPQSMATGAGSPAPEAVADASSNMFYAECSSAAGIEPSGIAYGSSSISACRSKSMPSPGLLRSHSSCSGNILGIGALMAGVVSPVAHGLTASHSTPPPHPFLQTAASADFQQQLSKPSDLPRHNSVRRTSSRFSNSNICNPSRLSQSSAASEFSELHIGAQGSMSSSSNNGSHSIAVSGNGSPTPGTRHLSLRSAFERHQPAAAVCEDVVSNQGSVQQQLRGAMIEAIGQLQQLGGSGVGAGIDQIVSIDVDGPGNLTTAAVADCGFDRAPQWTFCHDSPTARPPDLSVGADATAAADIQVQSAMPSLPEVDFIERIGRGSFGDVYKGVWCGSVVAIKVIRVRQLPKQARASAAVSSAPSPAGNNLTTAISLDSPASLNSGTGSSNGTMSNLIWRQQQQQQSAPQQDQQPEEQEVAIELAQHEYESWLNANLRHPNIVQLFTSFTVVLEDRPAGLPSAGGSVGGLMWGAGVSWKTHLVMEYCELGTMQGALQQGLFKDPSCLNRCHPLWVLITAKEFCVAVSYLHSMDVVHGDLKSSNVLLKAAAATAVDGRGFVAKVSDFGLSRVMDAISAAHGTAAASATCAGDADAPVDDIGAPIGQWPVQPCFGALSHAAPELIRGEELSKASDVYSVGVLLWELVTGQSPFYGTHPGQLLNFKLCHPTSELLPFPADSPAALVALAQDCWTDCPAQRPSMSAVVDRLNSFASELLGEEQAVMLFPDIARTLGAQRRSAAAAASGVGCLSSRMSYRAGAPQANPAAA